VYWTVEIVRSVPYLTRALIELLLEHQILLSLQFKISKL